MSETEEKLVEHHYEGVLRHPRASEESRAAQFAPFSALNGYEQAIRSSLRTVARKRRAGTDRPRCVIVVNRASRSRKENNR